MNLWTSLIKTEYDRGGETLRGVFLLRLFALGLALLGFSACGLEDSPYLNPPTAYPATTEERFEFGHVPTNDYGSFSGYEVLYLIYQTEADASSAVASISADPLMATDAGYSILQNKYRYLRMLTEDSMNTNRPVASFHDVDEATFNQAFNIKVNINRLISGLEAYLSTDSQQIPETDVFRNDGSGKTESFRALEISVDDKDVAASATPPEQELYWYVQAWAFSSAYNTSTFLSYYSSAVPLGIIQIQR